MFNILRYFSVMGAVILIVVTTALVALYRQNAVHELVESTEGQNVLLARSFANTLWPRYSEYVISATEMDGDALRAREETAELHEALKTLTAGLPVLKIKIYNLDGLTVYSSQRSQMGADKNTNLGFLRSAKEGEPASKQSYRSTFITFSGAVRNRDLVESYLPIWGPDGVIEGVFELYTDVTPRIAKVDRDTNSLTVGLVIAFGLLYAMLILFARRANRIIRHQYADLVSSGESIQEKNKALEEAHGTLEQRVQQRTAELEKEVTERERAEAALEERLQQLEHAKVEKETQARAKDAVLGELSAVLDSIDYGILFMDSELRGRVINRAFQNMWGISEEFISKNPTMRELMEYNRHNGIYKVADEDWEAWTEQRQTAVRAGDIPAMEFERADDKVLRYQCVALSNGGRMLTYFDITQGKLHQAMLEQAKAEAEAANRAKSEFLAAMSHELRTPLNAIIGFSEVIKDETLGPEGGVKYRDYAQDIHNSGQHLLDLINDILDLAKVESGTDELHEENIDIPEITRSVIGLVRQRAEKECIELALEILENPPTLWADKRKLKQILVNLMANAIKFTEAGGKVTLKTRCDSKSGYVFQVIDTGIGISPEDSRKALSQFGQIDGDLNRAYAGTGLGLPLTKALVEQHGGSLDLQSEVDVGTTVTVRFPAERIVASPDNSDSLDVEDRAAS